MFRYAGTVATSFLTRYGIFDDVGNHGAGIKFNAVVASLKIQFGSLSALCKRC